MTFLLKIKKTLLEDSRTRNIFGHLALGGLYKVVSVLLGFVVVPITLTYLKSERYGIWSAVLNVLSWITIFDVGIGAGLRNRLSEALAKNDYESAKKFVSTSYAVIALISFVGAIAVVFVIPNVNWQLFFNSPGLPVAELTSMMLIACLLILINWTVSLCNQVFYAYQKSSWTGLSQVVSQTITLVGLLILGRMGIRSLTAWSGLYGLALLSSNIILSIVFFHKHHESCPSIAYIDFSKIKYVLSLGGKFFAIQISSLILSYSNSIIIMRLCGPESVTPFILVNKLFSIPVTLFSILMAPYWSGFTDSWTKKDMRWIIKTIKYLLVFFLCASGVSIFLAIFTNPILRIWVGSGIHVSQILIIMNLLYACVYCFNMIFSSFLNGIGKINLSFVISILSSILYIPLAYFFVKAIGPSGTLLASVIILLFSSIIQPLQTWYVLCAKGSNPFFKKLFLEY